MNQKTAFFNGLLSINPYAHSPIIKATLFLFRNSG